MKTLFFFLGGIVAVLLIVAVTVVIIRRKLRRFARRNFGTTNLSSVFQEAANESAPPKSLSGGDSIYLPRILEDFPTFDNTTTVSLIKEHLRKTLRQDLHFHGVSISDYRRSSLEKAIIYQTAFQYREGGTLRQKRYCVHYSFRLRRDQGQILTAKCPNCGATIPDPLQVKCEYCDSRLVNVLGNSWEITDTYER